MTNTLNDPAGTGRTVVGLNPWLPWPLTRWSWWTEPVRAERLAALRIGVGIALMVDVLGTYLPRAGDFFGRDSLGAPGVLTWPVVHPLDWHRGLLFGIESPAAWLLVLLVWAGAGLLLVRGVRPRGAAGVAWLLGVCVLAVNDYLHNGGDRVRNILLFYLLLCPCGAAWSIDAWRRRAGPVYIPPWPLRLLFVQLAMIYFFNGVYKLLGEGWQTGDVLHYVVGDLSWSRWSYAQVPVPPVVLRLLTWTVLAFELGFPLLVSMPVTRRPVLLLGAAFHIGTGVALQIGPFPLYMLCLYLPLLPWERLADRWKGTQPGDRAERERQRAAA
jgi:hypothetical protein